MAGSPARSGTADPGLSAQVGFMRASIDGEPWHATSGLQVAHRGGILAFSGAEGNRVLTLAIVTGGGPCAQPVGEASPANAMLVLAQGETWVADGRRGVGTVIIAELTAHRAAGTFALSMCPLDETQVRDCQVRDGAFDVRF